MPNLQSAELTWESMARDVPPLDHDFIQGIVGGTGTPFVESQVISLVYSAGPLHQIVDGLGDNPSECEDCTKGSQDKGASLVARQIVL